MKARGAATVELALGSLLFVTVLMVGLHLSETLWLSLKVQEAQRFAIWNATGMRSHLFRYGAVKNGDSNSIYRPSRRLHANAGPRAQQRYRDFNGLTGSDDGPGLSQVFTRALPIRVQCSREEDVFFRVGRGNDRNYAWYAAQRRKLTDFYRSSPALSCRASSTLEVMQVPQTFFQRGEGGYFDSPEIYVNRLRVCGIGRSNGGNCDGRLAVLHGDWALEGPRGGANRELNWDVRLEVDKTNRLNRPYREMTRALYEAGKGSHGDAAGVFAAMVSEDRLQASRAPHDESEFFMSYRGAERGYVDGLKIGSRQHKWNTSGVYFRDSTKGRQRKGRPNCFLGLPGCR